MRLPALFLSHGSPMLAITDSPARRFLLELGRALPRPEAERLHASYEYGVLAMDAYAFS